MVSTAYLFLFFTYFAEIVQADTYYIQQGQIINSVPSVGSSLEIYCYAGRPKYIIHIWQSISLQIDLKSDNYLYYEGGSPEEVQKEYLARRSSWSVSIFSWKQKHFKLDPFDQSCIGIDTKEPYKVFLNVIRIDYWKILRLLSGLVLFLSADKLSKNSLFYYICGISFGICASFLILIYFFSRLFPRKPMMYGVAICGWTVGVYILQMLWENIRTIVMNYQSYVAWYALVTGLISFIVCYRYGPVTNERTQNLIRWTLQSLGLLTIFLSSQFQEAAMGFVIFVLLGYNFPEKWLSKSRAYWKRKFPPKVNLITSAEYYQQGVKETTNALEELKKYCSSPECNQWKTVLKIKDVKRTYVFSELPLKNPKERFASFMEGNSHLSDNEILDYESSIQATDITDDEEDEDILTDEEM